MGILQDTGNNQYKIFEFTDDIKYTLKAGESKTVTMKTKLTKLSGSKEADLAVIDGVIARSVADPVGTLSIEWFPVIEIVDLPIGLFPDFSSAFFYPFPGRITLQTGPDFPLIKDWYSAQFDAISAPFATLPTPPTVVPSPSPSMVPSIAPSPPVTSSPVVPSPIPSPVVTPPVAPAA